MYRAARRHQRMDDRSLRSNSPKRRLTESHLKAYADAGVYSSDQHGTTRCLQVTSTNEGKFPFRVRANCFYWKMPFSRSRVRMSAQVEVKEENERPSLSEVENERYPLRVAPRTSADIWVSYD